MKPIYLDNHATTRTDPRVVEAMLPWLTEHYGNASSVGHPYGEQAREAVEASRSTIAQAIGAEPAEIFFTSGATESNNLAIRGVAERPRRRGDHLVSVVTEHNAVLAPLERLAARGYEVTLLEVEQQGKHDAGRIDPQQVADAITDQTVLVSVMLANNEIGVLQPLEEISTLCRDRGVLLHTDATQAVGKLSVDVRSLGADLMSFTAHKLHGPQGIGALWVRSGRPVVRLDPLIAGGGQERGRRGGTLNVAGIVGFAKAVELATNAKEERAEIGRLRDRLWELLLTHTDDLVLVGPELSDSLRLFNNLDVHIPGLDGETLMMHAPGVAFSSGAACSSADDEPSHVLRALGLSSDEARCSARFGLSRFTTEDDVTKAAEQIGRAITTLRGG